MPFELKRMDGQKVLITGGAGFIGSNLTIKCIELGAEVYLFSDIDSLENLKGYEKEIKLVIGNITKKDEIEKAVAEKDIIFHLAAQTSHTVAMEKPIEDIEINLIGTMNILESCRKINPDARIISLGTVTQAGIVNGAINESLTDNPIELYSAHKLICEKYFQIYSRAYGMHTSFLRLNTIYGERQRIDNPKRGITNFFIGKILRGEPITIYGDGKWIRDYNHVSNVIDALILCSQDEKSKGKSYVLGGDKMYFSDMVNEVVRAVEEFSGKKGIVTFDPFPEGEKKLDVGNTEVDYSKIKNELGWEPKLNFRKGIERTVKHYVK